LLGAVAALVWPLLPVDTVWLCPAGLVTFVATAGLGVLEIDDGCAVDAAVVDVGVAEPEMPPKQLLKVQRRPTRVNLTNRRRLKVAKTRFPVQPVVGVGVAAVVQATTMHPMTIRRTQLCGCAHLVMRCRLFVVQPGLRRRSSAAEMAVKPAVVALRF
jgi:hypothetical protein